jgi:hypothetical protein
VNFPQLQHILGVKRSSDAQLSGFPLEKKANLAVDSPRPHTLIIDQLSSVKLPLAIDDRLERRPFLLGTAGKIVGGKRINSWKLFNAAVT